MDDAILKDYAEIQRVIGKFDPNSIIFLCMEKLNESDSIEHQSKYPPFGILLLLKWTVELGNFHPKKLPLISPTQFDSFVNLWHKMHDHTRMPNDYTHILLFFRTLAFQQFWLQSNANKSNVMRQYALFRRREKNHYFNQIFKNEYNLELPIFLDLLFALYAWHIAEDELVIKKTWFSNISEYFPTATLDPFFKIIAGDISDHRANIKKDKNTDILYQFYNRSPFRLKPFIKANENESYLLISKAVLAYFLEDGVYEMLKNPDSSKFMNKFGPIFESYVKYVLETTNIHFDYRENISKICSSKAVDFVILENKHIVMIEAKGIDLPLFGHVSADIKIVANKVKTSILKAIEQGYATIDAYKEYHRLSGNESFLLIITFKELNLGIGRSFTEAFGDEFSTNRTSTKRTISSSNIFIIDISEFEDMCQLLVKSNMTLYELLKKTRDYALNANTERLLFRQCLFEVMGGVGTPKHLDDLMESEMARFSKYFKKDEN